MEYFKTFTDKESQSVDFEQLAAIIRSDEELKKKTMLYRDLLAQGHEKAAKEVKESTPQVAVSFRMEGGKGKDNCRECLHQVLIDFDAKAPGERLATDELERVKTFMRTSYHARLGYESISGLGYHIVVPFRLPEGIEIDMAADQKRAEEIYTRAYRSIARQYTVWCGHAMDEECKNVNRMTGLAHDPLVAYRPDAREFRLTREELGIDADGRLIKMKTPKRTVDKEGNPVSVPLGDHLERAVRMVEEGDTVFAPGSRHNFIMRVSFILNRMGVDEDEAAAMVHMVSDHEQELWRECFPKWFVAMVAGWTDETIVNHQVIVLIGRQGIFKSSWINHLLPPELQPYSTDSVDIERLDKDEQLRAAEYGLINIDELDRLTDRQQNKIKSMITSTNVDVRAPFGRHKEKRVRVASYAASGNKEEFLTDQTGNRRWLPFHVANIDSPYTHRLPYDGMFAQALYLLRDGFNYWFDLDDIHALEQHVEAFMIPTSEEELIPIYFSPARLEDAGSKFMTLAEIAAKIVAFGCLKKNPDPRRLGAIMTKLGYKKSRSGHNSTRGYYVREHTQSEIEQAHNPEIF